ncbi:hypothetical protein ACN26Y_21575 [Micromonospora sp. WMMD558]|uniref:hypothetical protein n=1 Tax=Micromonospora sp. WMMD558 TaxID=3403462 RepID=UPI003BF5C5FB
MSVADTHDAPERAEPLVRGGWVSGEVIPPTSGNSLRTATMLAGIALLAVLAVLIGAAVASGGDDHTDRSSSGAAPEELRDLPPEGDSVAQSWAEPSISATEASDPEEEALSALQNLNRQDLPTVSLDGRYAAQLASKTVGIVDPHQVAANGSHTFYAQDILVEHTQLRQELSGDATIVLLLSTDYGRQQLYEGQPLWVTFALVPDSSKEAVGAWCAARFPQITGSALENRCVPRRLNPPGSVG